MHIERNRPRISPTDFIDFNVSLKMGDFDLKGYLGNISENGLCAIIPYEGERLAEVGLESTGIISSRRLADNIDFKGRVAWASSSPIRGKPHMLVGVEFKSALSLPDEIIAISLASEE